jgi:hypothetical protein
LGSVVRAWWAMRSQKRRRHATSPPVDPPALPVVALSNGNFSVSGSLVSSSFDITVDHKTWPTASLEIWFAMNSPSSYALLSIVGSTAENFSHPAITDSEAILYYKARYQNGDIVGPFSDDLEIDISL